jgi:hypothetical protein
MANEKTFKGALPLSEAKASGVYDAIEISPLQAMQGLGTLGKLLLYPQTIQQEAEKAATAALLASYQADKQKMAARIESLEAQLQKERDRFHRQDFSTALASQGLWAEEP